MRMHTNSNTVLQDRSIPAHSKLAGWAALVQAFHFAAPVRRLSCVSEQHVRGSQRREGDWTVFDTRYWPGDSFADHLTFALRHETIDLLILKRLFDTVPKAEVEALIQAAPTGIQARRAWYLYEILTNRTLAVTMRAPSRRSNCSTPRPISLANRSCQSDIVSATICSATEAFARSSGAPQRWNVPCNSISRREPKRSSAAPAPA